MSEYRQGIMEEYNDPLKIINETKKVHSTEYFISLEQIPDEFHRVKIDGMTEVTDIDDITENSFKVDYETSSGRVFFHPSKSGQDITIKEYWGLGVTKIYSDRIVTQIGEYSQAKSTLESDIEVINQMKDDYYTGTHFEVVKSEQGKFIATRDNIQYIQIPIGLWNPLIDVLDISWNGYPLIKDINYKIDGGQIVLLDWMLKQNDVLYFDVKKGVNSTPPVGADGGDLMNGSITQSKLSQDIQDKLNRSDIFMSRLTNSVKLTEDTTNVVIGISEYNYQTDPLEVHVDGILLEENKHYTINDNYISIDKIGDGVWSKDAEFCFVVFKNVSYNSFNFTNGSYLQDRSIPKTKLTNDLQAKIDLMNSINLNSNGTTIRLVNWVKTTQNTVNVPIGISGYDSAKDSLEVHLNGSLLEENKDYVLNSDKISINKLGDGNWVSNSDFRFVVFQTDTSKNITFKPVNKDGDTMLGDLTLAGNPTQPLHATTKQYVDNVFTTEASRVIAENSRVSAETSRVNAENARVSAENQRVSDINAIKTAYNNAITTASPLELSNARHDSYLNKDFNNISARLDTNSLNIYNNANAIKDAIHSGYIKMSDLDYTTMATTPNTIKTLTESICYVNGYKITIPAGTTITLNAPPTSGTREDLVFLEVYFTADTNGANVLNYRFRVVDGVDFNTYPEGFHKNIYDTSNTAYNSLVTPQGGNSTPVVYDNTSSTSRYRTQFSPAIIRPASSLISIALNDYGLYTSGTGDATSKTLLGTVDGYVYAIPLFKVKRRNSSAYGVSNGNGASLFKTTKYTQSYTINVGYSYDVNVLDTSIFTVGKKYYVMSYGSNYIHQVNSITSPTTMNITCLSGNGTFTGSDTYKLYPFLDRLDGLYADIIVERDIIDLRHLVSLTGFNYQTLQDEVFGQLLRNELQTKDKKKMVKTYHGISKTPTDANTIFYSSLDGTTIAEVGGALTVNNVGYAPSPTGLGLIGTSSRTASKTLSGISKTAGTLDFLVYIPANSVSITPICISNGDDYTKPEPIRFTLNSSGTVVAQFRKTDQVGSANWDTGIAQVVLSNFKKGVVTHIRISWSSNTAYVRQDGNLVGSVALPSVWDFPATPILRLLHAKSASNVDQTFAVGCIIADVSVSNIDRSSTFATLPQDFRDGYARISYAFNGQRKVFSDASVSEYVQGLVKASDASRPKQQTVTQAVSGQWASGDTVKIKGLGGELVSGVIDTDTALARIINVVDGTSDVLYLDDVSKFNVSDTFRKVNVDGSSSNDYTVTAVDTVNKTITVNTNLFVSGDIGCYLVESTASSSIPTIKANLIGTIPSTNANSLYTNMPSTFSTIDSTYSGYDIMIISGTGAGQRRTIQSYVGATKTAIVSTAWTTNPDATSQFVIYNYPVTGTWSNLATNEATFTFGTNALLSNQDIQIEYSLIEQKGQGAIGEVYTALLGGEYKGKKLIVGTVAVRDDFVIADGNYLNGSALNTFLDGLNGTDLQHIIDMIEAKYNSLLTIDKKAWLKANVSKISITSNVMQIEFVGKTGYEMLVPENPNKTDGLAGVLLVRRETKEIQSYFNSMNTDGVVTYGDYVPKQSRLVTDLSLVGGYLLTNPKGYFTTLTTKAVTVGYNKATKYDLLDDFSIIDNLINSGLNDGSQLITTYANAQAMIQDVNYLGSYNSYGRISVGKINNITTSNLYIKDATGAVMNYYDISKYQNKNTGTVLLVTLAKNAIGNLHLILMACQDIIYGEIGRGTTTRVIAYELPNRPLIK